MKRALTLLVVLTAGLLLSLACSLTREAVSGPATSLQDVQDVGYLQAMFNRDAGHTRLILLLSPT